MLARTCKKFFELVKKTSRVKSAERHLQDVFHIQMQYSFLTNFLREHVRRSKTGFIRLLNLAIVAKCVCTDKKRRFKSE